MRRLTALCTAALAAASLGFAPALGTPTTSDPLGSDAAGSGAPVRVAVQDQDRDARTIVVLHDHVEDVAATAQRLLAPAGRQPLHLYASALKGFVAPGTPQQLAGLVEDPAVDYLEADRPVRTAGQLVPRGVRRVDGVVAAGIGSGGATSVDIAILDTGISNHADLRVTARLDCTDTSLEANLEYVDYLVYGSCKSGGTDTDGHGTHVAGIAGARDNGRDVVGVAPGARLWSIKVVDGADGGRLSDVVRGVDEVARRADQIEVANISLVADGRSEAMDDAIAGATDAGAVIVVSAGNGSENASGTTPANSPDAITVSAITDLDGKPGGRRSGSCLGKDDHFATYSNFGSVVDIAAPGSCIDSTRRGGGVVQMSGTSMAAPHVAGAAGLRIAQRGYAATSRRSSVVLDYLLNTSARENTACGYVGSPSNERLLDLRKGC